MRVTLSSVATHGGRRYFSRLAIRFTWRGHTYAGTEMFADPCGNTAGCWVTPGIPSYDTVQACPGPAGAERA